MAIDENNFPDAVFREYVGEFDTDGNGSLSESEISGCTRIDVGGSLSVRSLEGIEYFTALEELRCSYTNVSSLDVSQNPALESLVCINTDVSSLDVSQNPALWRLDCSSTKISSLDVSQNPDLEDLRCSETNVSSLDVSQNPALGFLDCSYTNVSSLDVSQNPALWFFVCSGNVVWLDDSHQLDLAKYDPLFDKSKVTESTYVEWNGDVITLQEGRDSGTYVYDCGRGKTMTVTVRRSVLEKPTVFTDVPQTPGNWKYDSVRYVNDRSIMGGVGGSNLFQPDNKLTRAMFATVLYRMAREPETSYSSKFSDVKAGQWYSSAILWANRKGIVQGYSNGSFGINDNITREQIAKMLYLYGKSRGYDVSGTSSLDGFTDKGAVSNWAEGFLKWAVHAKMISGKPNGDGSYRLDPKGEATRAECAKMLMMFLEKYN